MAAAGDHLAAVVHVDVVPAGELALHLPVDLLVSVLDAAQSLVGEHDAEAEGVVGRVPLPDSDLGIRQQLPSQRGEIQPAAVGPDVRAAAVARRDLQRDQRAATGQASLRRRQ